MISLASLFIVGMPRSGTTLLAGLLSAHSRLAVAPETGYFNWVWKPIERAGGFLRWNLVEFHLKRWFQRPTLAPLKLAESGAMEMFHHAWDKGQLTHHLILESILGGYAANQGKEFWGEKSPEHFMYVPAIKSEFPDARIISIVRDPRDVHLSLAKVPWNRGNAFNHALQWREYQVMAKHYIKLYGSSFYQLRYEDLIQNPSLELERLMQHIGLKFEPKMLEQYHRQPLFDPSQEPWKNRARMPIDPENREKWRQGLKPDELGIFSRVCGRYLRQHGYELPDNISCSPRKLMTGLDRQSILWWARTRWRMRRNRDPWLDRPLAAAGKERNTSGPGT